MDDNQFEKNRANMVSDNNKGAPVVTPPKGVGFLANIGTYALDKIFGSVGGSSNKCSSSKGSSSNPKYPQRKSKPFKKTNNTKQQHVRAQMPSPYRRQHTPTRRSNLQQQQRNYLPSDMDIDDYDDVLKECDVLPQGSSISTTTQGTPEQSNRAYPSGSKNRNWTISTLFNIIENSANAQIISWSDSGKSFKVLNEQALFQLLNSRTSSYIAFYNKLQRYGFSKERGTALFSHPNFIRGRPELLVNIKTTTKVHKQSRILMGDTTLSSIHDNTTSNCLADKSMNQLLDWMHQPAAAAVQQQQYNYNMQQQGGVRGLPNGSTNGGHIAVADTPVSAAAAAVQQQQNKKQKADNHGCDKSNMEVISLLDDTDDEEDIVEVGRKKVSSKVSGPMTVADTGASAGAAAAVQESAPSKVISSEAKPIQEESTTPESPYSTLTLNENDPLLIFLRSQESCIKGSVDEFYTWLVKSEDIDSMLALKEAVNEDDYLNDMKDGDGGGSGVKGFKRKAFLRAISEYFNDKPDARSSTKDRESCPQRNSLPCRGQCGLQCQKKNLSDTVEPPEELKQYNFNIQQQYFNEITNLADTQMLRTLVTLYKTTPYDQIRATVPVLSHLSDNGIQSHTKLLEERLQQMLGATAIEPYQGGSMIGGSGPPSTVMPGMQAMQPGMMQPGMTGMHGGMQQPQIITSPPQAMPPQTMPKTGMITKPQPHLINIDRINRLYSRCLDNQFSKKPPQAMPPQTMPQTGMMAAPGKQQMISSQTREFFANGPADVLPLPSSLPKRSKKKTTKTPSTPHTKPQPPLIYTDRIAPTLNQLYSRLDNQFNKNV